jgi:hypothetical protein
MAILMIILGIVLLLPGVCAVGVMVMELPGSTGIDGLFVAIWLVCFAIAAGGIALIRAGARQSRGGAPGPAP